MAKIEITRTELVWPGKYTEDGTRGQGQASFLGMMSDRISIARDLLAPHGALLVHLDATAGAVVRQVLDEVFGQEGCPSGMFGISRS
jgi:hypothetical protein